MAADFHRSAPGMSLRDVSAHHIGHGATAAESCGDKNKQERTNQFHLETQRAATVWFCLTFKSTAQQAIASADHLLNY